MGSPSTTCRRIASILNSSEECRSAIVRSWNVDTVSRRGRSFARVRAETFLERLMKRIWSFLKDERGTETLEWGLVCGLIVVGAIIAITAIGPKVSGMWNDVNNSVPDV